MMKGFMILIVIYVHLVLIALLEDSYLNSVSQVLLDLLQVHIFKVPFLSHNLSPRKHAISV